MQPKLKKWRKKTPSKHKSYALKRNRIIKSIEKANMEQLEKL